MIPRTCRLDGAEIDSVRSACWSISKQLEFPPWFRPNLDALWDTLTTEIEGPVEIIWDACDKSETQMGVDYKRVANLLITVDQDRSDITVKFNQSPEKLHNNNS